MNSTKIMAFNEISQWIKYKGFTQEHLAQILHAVNKECLERVYKCENVEQMSDDG